MTLRLHTGSEMLACLMLAASAVGCMAPADEVIEAEEPAPSAETLEQVRGGSAETFPSDSQVTVTAQALGKGCGKFTAPKPGVSTTSQTVIFGEIKKNYTVSGFREIDCFLTIDYKYPAGWVFDLPEVQLRGFVNNDLLNTSQLALAVGMGLGEAVETQVFPPRHSKNISMDITRAKAALVGGSSRCGATSATVRVHITAASQGFEGNSLTTLDAVDTRLRWRRCL